MKEAGPLLGVLQAVGEPLQGPSGSIQGLAGLLPAALGLEDAKAGEPDAHGPGGALQLVLAEEGQSPLHGRLGLREPSQPQVGQPLIGPQHHLPLPQLQGLADPERLGKQLQRLRELPPLQQGLPQVSEFARVIADLPDLPQKVKRLFHLSQPLLLLLSPFPPFRLTPAPGELAQIVQDDGFPVGPV